MTENKKYWIGGSTAFLILTLIDQISKYFASLCLAGTSGITLISGVFELYYLENRGAAFGLLTGCQAVFIVTAVLMLGLTAYVYLRLPGTSCYHLLRLVCILIAAGAVGNMIDRLRHNYVIDFLYISLIDFPVFNIADCYVCIGAALAVLALFTVYRNEDFLFLLPHTKQK